MFTVWVTDVYWLALCYIPCLYTLVEHTLYQPVDKQGEEKGNELPRFLAVFDTVSVAAVVRRTTAYTPPAARRTVGLFGGKNARNLA